MLGRGVDQSQSIIFNDLKAFLNPQDPLYRLADRLPWSEIEDRFAELYAAEGRPSKPIRLMVSLLLLKNLRNLSDEVVVREWVQNAYMQYFSGMRQFQWELPCDPTELVYFRKRIGTEGAEAILRFTIEMHGSAAAPQTVIVDTTVQEKAIAPPRDRRLYRKAAERVRAIAEQEGITLKRTYRRIIPKLMRLMITANYPRAVKRARKAERKLRRIGLRMLADLNEKLGDDRRFERLEELEVLRRVLTQRAGDSGKVFSVHEPQVYAVARGKDRAMYEFGTKVSVATSARSGVIVGAMNLARNQYDGHTLPEVLDQVESLTGKSVKTIIGDKGYRGQRWVGATRVVTPVELSDKGMIPSTRRWLRRLLRRRSAIEPTIGHLKSDHRLGRNHLRGWLGDEMNVLLACAGWNLALLMRRILCLYTYLRVLSLVPRIPINRTGEASSLSVA